MANDQRLMTNPMALIFLGTFAYLLLMLILGSLFVGGIYMATRKPQGQLDTGRRSFIGMGGEEDTSYAVFLGAQLVIQVLWEHPQLFLMIQVMYIQQVISPKLLTSIPVVECSI